MQNKIIALGIILICASSTFAWDSEGGLTEDELYDIMFNQAYMYTDINNPSWYSPITETINDWCVRYEAYFTHTPPDIRIRVQIKKMIWDGSGYVEDTDFIDLDSSLYRELVVNSTETVQMPILRPMREVFKNNINEFDDFKTTDKDYQHPDVLNISIDVGADGESLDHSSYGYMTFNDASLKELESQTMGGDDYGFVSTGKGSDAGSGGIYEGVHIYGAGDVEGAGIGGAFNTLFFLIIPLIFILAICRFVFGLV